MGLDPLLVSAVVVSVNTLDGLAGRHARGHVGTELNNLGNDREGGKTL